MEKAITTHGGPSVVAERLGWKLQAKPRKPRGYWDSLENVRQEVDEFIKDKKLQPGKKGSFCYFFGGEKNNKNGVATAGFSLTFLLYLIFSLQKLCL